MKVLRGQKLHEADYADVERQLRELFYRLVFKPIVDLLAPHNAQVKAAKGAMRNSKELRNAAFDPIVGGINSGKIQYVDGVFSGDFSAAISRALRSYGARFNRTTKAYTLLPQQLPVEVLGAAKEYAEAAKALHDRVDEVLDGIAKDLASGAARVDIDASKVVGGMDKSFDGHFGDALGTEGLSKQAKELLEKKYTSSLKPYIMEFTGKMTLELREIVAENARQGYRFDHLVERIQERFDVSSSKAEFLARNETSRFVSEHREQRFADAGVTHYVWQTADDTRVRPDHKKLDGKVFEYAKPPIVDAATGRRANPGGDFLCRCVDSPVIPGVLSNA